MGQTCFVGMNLMWGCPEVEDVKGVNVSIENVGNAGGLVVRQAARRSVASSSISIEASTSMERFRRCLSIRSPSVVY